MELNVNDRFFEKAQPVWAKDLTEEKNITLGLYKNGYYAQLLEEIKGYFLYMAKRTGTLWEHKDTYASCNHGFASYVAELIYKAECKKN